MKTPRTRYSQEFKIKAVELMETRSVISASRELHVSKDTLRNWKRAFAKGQLVLTGNPNLRIKSKEEEELIRLKKELYEIKMERDILKKAVSIFSKSDK